MSSITSTEPFANQSCGSCARKRWEYLQSGCPGTVCPFRVEQMNRLGGVKTAPPSPFDARDQMTGYVSEGTKVAEPLYKNQPAYKHGEITPNEAMQMLTNAALQLQVSVMRDSQEQRSVTAGKLQALLFRMIQEGHLDWYTMHTAEQEEGMRLLKMFHPVVKA